MSFHAFTPIFVTFHLTLTVLLFCGQSDAVTLQSCPSSPEIAPCQCSPVGYAFCNGPNITQAHIDNLLVSIRAVNELHSSTYLDIANIRIQDTPLTALDLTSFLGFRVRDLVISGNLDLSLIYLKKPPPPFPSPLGFLAQNVQIYTNNLNESSMEDLFQLVGDNVTSLTLADNKIRGLQKPGEFVKGLGHLTVLQYLTVVSNPISKIANCPFDGQLIRLLTLDLSRNQIVELGPEAFRCIGVSEPEIVSPTGNLTINLSGNNLTDAGVAPDTGNGLSSIGRPTNLVLRSNHFVFISEGKFAPFLRARGDNFLQMEGNQFVCDDRMKWLKVNREKFESRVTGVDCTNDPGKTIFTTDLVH